MPRRTDWLRSLYGLVLALLAFAGAAFVLDVGAQILGARPVTALIPLSALSTSLPAGLAVPDGGTVVELRVLDPSAAQVALYWLGRAPEPLLLLVLGAMLAQLLRRARRADPFTPATVRSLRRVAGLTLAGGVIASAVAFVGQLALAMSVTGNQAAGSYPLPLVWVLSGLGLQVVAEIVNRGVSMRTELDAVI